MRINVSGFCQVGHLQQSLYNQNMQIAFRQVQSYYKNEVELKVNRVHELLSVSTVFVVSLWMLTSLVTPACFCQSTFSWPWRSKCHVTCECVCVCVSVCVSYPVLKTAQHDYHKKYIQMKRRGHSWEAGSGLTGVGLTGVSTNQMQR